MSDELLRHISDNPSLLVRRSVFDPETKKTERIWTGQSTRLLLKMSSHANKERIVFIGRNELMEKCDLNGQSIDTIKRRFLLDGILTKIGKRSYQGSAPVDCYLINLPGLPDLEDVMIEEEIKQRARKIRDSRKTAKVVLAPALESDLQSALAPALDHDLPVRHKQELEHELQLQLQQVFDRYADLKRRNQTLKIRNEKAWREGVKKSALKEMSPRGDTYGDRAIELLKQGYRAEDIAGFIADGCVNGQNIVFWDKRPGFVDATKATDFATANFGQQADYSNVPF